MDKAHLGQNASNKYPRNPLKKITRWPAWKARTALLGKKRVDEPAGGRAVRGGSGGPIFPRASGRPLFATPPLILKLLWASCLCTCPSSVRASLKMSHSPVGGKRQEKKPKLNKSQMMMIISGRHGATNNVAIDHGVWTICCCCWRTGQADRLLVLLACRACSAGSYPNELDLYPGFLLFGQGQKKSLKGGGGRLPRWGVFRMRQNARAGVNFASQEGKPKMCTQAQGEVSASTQGVAPIFKLK